MEDKMNHALSAVQTEFPDITMDHIRSKSRKREYKVPRHIAMYLMRNYDRGRIVDHGSEFNRHYTTLIHAEGVVRKDMDLYPDFKSIVDNIENVFIGKIYSKEDAV